MKPFVPLALLWLVAGTSAGAAQRVDEKSVLDAPEKRVLQDDYHADRAVTAQGADAGGWHIYAGAAIDARHIDLTMTNVRGEVRFRAEVDRLNALLRRARRPR